MHSNQQGLVCVTPGGQPVWRPEAEDQPGQGRLLRPSRLPAGRPAVGRRRPRWETHLWPSHRPAGTAEVKGQIAVTFLMHVHVCEESGDAPPGQFDASSQSVPLSVWHLTFTWKFKVWIETLNWQRPVYTAGCLVCRPGCWWPTGWATCPRWTSSWSWWTGRWRRQAPTRSSWTKTDPLQSSSGPMLALLAPLVQLILLVSPMTSMVKYSQCMRVLIHIK